MSVGGVTARDPVLSRPGEAIIRFDSLGRLRGFQAIPVAASIDAPEPPAADWNALFEYAQLEPSVWTEVPADFIPLVCADRRAWWSTERLMPSPRRTPAAW